MDVMMKPRQAVAFTLIELLVVISIIALLVGILLPALGAARESARGVVCQTHVKNLSTAFFAYGTDNTEWWPGWSTLKINDTENHLGGWIPNGGYQSAAGVTVKDIKKGSIWQYSADLGVYECPSDPWAHLSSGLSYTISNHIYRLPTGSGGSASDWPTLPNGNSATVAFSARLVDPAVQVTLSRNGVSGKMRYPNADKFRTPSNLIFIVDEGGPAQDASLPGGLSNIGVNDGFFENLYSKEPGGNSSAGAADKSKWYHSDGAAFGFGDGHGEIRKKTDPEIFSYKRSVTPQGRDFFYSRIWDPAAQSAIIKGQP
jgi:prepilin-type N-terminal cleavage/methylation domain-containing protein